MAVDGSRPKLDARCSGCAPTSRSSSSSSTASRSRTSTRRRRRRSRGRCSTRMREFYEHSYANVHRGVYRLAERATEGYEGARREGCGVRQRAVRARGDLHPQRDRGAQPRRLRVGAREPRPGDVVVVTELEHHANFVPWQFIAKPHGRELPAHPDRRPRRAAARRARRDRARRQRQGRRDQPRLELARHDQPSREARRVGARAGRDHGRRRRAGGAAPAVDVQALGATSSRSRRTSCCGPSGVGVLWGRAELLEAMSPFNLGGEMIRSVALERTTWNELPHKFEAGTPADRGGLRPRRSRSTTSRRSGSMRSRRTSTSSSCYALERLAELDVVRVFGPPADAARGHRLVRGRGHPPARRRADPRLGGHRGPRGPPLHAAADDAGSASPRRRARASTSTRFPDEVDRLDRGLHKVKKKLG